MEGHHIFLNGTHDELCPCNFGRKLIWDFREQKFQEVEGDE